MTLPAGKADKIIGPHQPAEPVLRAALLQCPQGLIGECRPDPDLWCDYPNAGVAGNKMAGPGKAGAKRGHVGAVLQRVLRAHKPPDFVEVKLPRGADRQVEMPLMRRVERPAKQPDPQPAMIVEQLRRKMPPESVWFSHREAGRCP